MSRYIRPVILVLMIMSLASLAGAVYQTAYNGDIALTLNQELYAPGDPVTVDVTVRNQEPHPVVNASVILHLVHGCEQPTYPSQQSDCDTVIQEDVIRNIQLPGDDTKHFEHRINLPRDARSGTYRVDAYLKTERTPIDGIPFIFANPTSRSFTVTGDGTTPSIKIVRSQTAFRGSETVIGDWDPDTQNFQGTGWPWIAGPVGVLVTDTMEQVPGRIVLENTGDTTKQVDVDITVCSWDDTHCPDPMKTTETVTVPPGMTTVETAVDAPANPGAYAVRIVARQGEQMRSLYRNRIIREGETARIRKLTVSNPYYASGEEVRVDLLVGTSPDHYTNPVINNLAVAVAVEDLGDGTTVLEETRTVRQLNQYEPFTNYSFTAPLSAELSRFNVSAVLTAADGTVYDRYSYVVEAAAFAGPLQQLSIGETRLEGETLSIELCGRDRSGIPTTGEVQTVLMQDGSVIASNTANIEQCGTLQYNPVEPGTYDLVANAGKQFRFTVTAQQGETGLSAPAGPGVMLGILGVVVLIILIAWRRRQ